MERIAVLRFENLSPDPSLSWMGRALSEVVAAQITGVSGIVPINSTRLHSYDRVLGVRPVSAPGISAESTQAFLASATRVVYGDYSVHNGKLDANITIEDPRAVKTLSTYRYSGRQEDVLAAADALARHITAQAKPYTTRSSQALGSYIQALESTDAPHMEQGLMAAIQADPDFAPPYRLLAQERAQRGDRAGAVSAIEQAQARGDRIPPVDRARIAFQSADLAGDVNGRIAALTNLVKLDPSDSTAWRALGENATNHHDYRQALESLQRAATLEPSDGALWNSIGYAAAYLGQLETGMEALRRYQALSPNDANPLDSMGDINLASGRLAEAEQFYMEAYRKNPAMVQGELLKAAVAHLLTGDSAGADKIADQYLSARVEAKDPIAGYRKAQWLWITGHRKEAMQQLQTFAQTAQRDIASIAEAEMSLWSLMLGDRTAAAQLADRAVHAANPAARGAAIVAGFLAMPPASPSEWSVRAAQVFGGPAQTQIRNFALAHALLVNKEFQAAQLLLKEMWDSGNPIADEGLPVMLAWSYLETGKVKEAGPLLRFNPIPNSNGLTPYTSFYLPRLFYLRGQLAEKEGHEAEAKAEYRKFIALSGVPLIWGEEKKVAP